ncbi:MAG: M23 family metallopeptidase [Marmoricola sp.]
MELLSTLFSALGAVVALHGVWPIEPPTVIRGFEAPSGAWAAGHRGVDLAGAIGTPVHASVGGTVSFAGVIAGRGVVVIRHGDTRTSYEPVTAEVAVSEVVAAGERIGTLELGGSHCLPAACLHWGWLRGNKYLDPLRLIGAPARVRLLPLTPVDAPGGMPS